MNEKEFSPEHFLDAVDMACKNKDRAAMAELSKLAFKRKSLVLQSAVRQADTFIIACMHGNLDLQEASRQAFYRLMPKIRAGL